MTYYNNSCTQEKNCKYGDKDLGICYQCQENNYLDLKDGKCKSNQENNDYKFCSIISEKCTFCDSLYYLSEDKKCTETKNCASAKNGICESCIENFYLGKDNFCTNVENCAYSFMYICNECIDNFYYNINSLKCEKINNDKFKNCKSSFNGTQCDFCKSNYYLSLVDHLCYNNEEKGNLYKCVITDDTGKLCYQCEKGYYWGVKDFKCSKIEGCALLSEKNDEKCSECEETFCLNLKNGICFNNENSPNNENELIYFNCNKTNEEGTFCEECINDNFEIINGVCYNIEGCEKLEDGKCIECKEKSQCLNKDFGCVDSFNDGCLKCDNSLDFDICDECKEGYELDKDGICVKI